jgi:hypothetical protein
MMNDAVSKIQQFKKNLLQVESKSRRDDDKENKDPVVQQKKQLPPLYPSTSTNIQKINSDEEEETTRRRILQQFDLQSHNKRKREVNERTQLHPSKKRVVLKQFEKSAGIFNRGKVSNEIRKKSPVIATESIIKQQHQQQKKQKQVATSIPSVSSQQDSQKQSLYYEQVHSDHNSTDDAFEESHELNNTSQQAQKITVPELPADQNAPPVEESPDLEIIHYRQSETHESDSPIFKQGGMYLILSNNCANVYNYRVY